MIGYNMNQNLWYLLPIKLDYAVFGRQRNDGKFLSYLRVSDNFVSQ